MLPVLRPLLAALADRHAEREQLEELLIEVEQDSGRAPARDRIELEVQLDSNLAELKRLSPFDPEAFIDLGTVARLMDIPHHGLRGLTALLLGFRISKQARTSNWSAGKLSIKQINYAATDAWVGRELYFKFKKEKFL